MHLSLDEVTVVDIELTNKCNAACPGCNRSNYEPGELNNFEYTLEDIKRIIPQQVLRPGVEFFFGGTVDEATMNKEVVEICEYILSSGANIVLETNTGACPAEVFTKLGNLSNKYNHNLIVRFSVDGLEHTNHLYRVNVKWKTVLRNMKAYAKTGGKCLWQYLVFDHNYDDIEEAYKLSKQLNIPFQLRQGTRDPAPYLSLITEKNKVTKKIEKKKVVVNHSSKFKHDHIEERLAIKKQKYVEPEKIKCFMIHKKQVFIDSNYKLWPCCWYATNSILDPFYKKLDELYGKDWNSLKNQTMQQILDHEYYKQVLYQTFVNDEFKNMFNKTCQLECGNEGYRNKTKRVDMEDK